MNENETPEAPEAPPVPSTRPATFVETLLIIIMAQNSCLLGRARVTDEELQDAMRQEFEAMGLAIPPNLIFHAQE